MINIPEPFKGTENFWELNSQYILLFDDFYNKDKTKNKNKSSKIMWALTFKLNPDSVFYNLPNKDEVIKDKFIKDEKFKWATYSKEESLFHSTILTEATRALVGWDETMKKRRTFLNEQDFTLDAYVKGKLVKGNAEQLDRMLANTAKLYQDYAKIHKDLKEEKMKKGKGNRPVSASDANEI